MAILALASSLSVVDAVGLGIMLLFAAVPLGLLAVGARLDARRVSPVWLVGALAVGFLLGLSVTL
jgi:hypothetical protein